MSQETDLIKERLDLGEIISEYVQLKRVGGHFKGLCPFHQEKTPSFIVSPDKGIWHCFGCSAGGDVISFVQQIEGLDFPAALKMLAERAGVTLQAQAPTRYDPRARQFELHRLAARFYHELLINQSVGAKAKEYLQGRGVHEKTMRDFEIGYAPQRWDSVQLFLQKRGFSDREMLDSGLVGRSQRGQLYDRFRGRIMFPIYDIQGRVVGFGGRITPWHATGEEGKYINSPETSIYAKRRVVYNLHRAKKSLHQRPCVVVEGYMDVVMLVQAGVDNVVASSGTAFTAEQVTLLRRYTTTLHFAFDADAAGIKAAEAATKEAVGAGLRVATVLFPAGQDPADVAQESVERLQECLNQPTSLVEVLLRHLQSTDAGNDREQVLARILPLVQTTANTVQQGEMIQTLAATLHVPEAVIMTRLSAAKSTALAPVTGVAQMTGEHETALTSDQLLLGLVILEPSVRPAATNEWSEEFFGAEAEQALFQSLRNMAEQPDFMGQSPDEVVAQLPADVQILGEALRQMAEEHVAHISTTAEAEVRSLVRSLRTQVTTVRLRALRDRVAQLSGEERVVALQEFQAILKELSTSAS